MGLNGYNADWLEKNSARIRGDAPDWRVPERPPLETEEQQALIRWTNEWAVAFPILELIHSIPNGATLLGRTLQNGKRVSFEANKLLAEGLKPGVPDLFLPVARGVHHGLYIEMKRVKKGRTSAAQKSRIERLKEQGYMVEVCAGANAAKRLIVEYLGLEKEIPLD